MTKIMLSLVCAALAFGAFAEGATRADKIRAMQELAVKKSRLGIPLIVGMDVIHGYETIFPIPLALSCSWDLDAVEQSARIAAKEASADGINWTYSPMVDICVDARWGRYSEGNGEDPFLAGAMGGKETANHFAPRFVVRVLRQRIIKERELRISVRHASPSIFLNSVS